MFNSMAGQGHVDQIGTFQPGGAQARLPANRQLRITQTAVMQVFCDHRHPIELVPFLRFLPNLHHTLISSGLAMSERHMIRQAVASDEAAVRACAEQAYAPYIRVIGRKPAPMLADYKAQIAAGHVYLSTGEPGELHGFIVFFPVDQQMLLENVAVSEAGRGKGIGKSLIQFCEAQAMGLGLGSVHLYTNVKMTDNLSIYPRLGYLEVERRSEDGFERVYFEKRLG
jgi:GNAT superfamily N-acetyltransferase